jgi:hypothetical protein
MLRADVRRLEQSNTVFSERLVTSEADVQSVDFGADFIIRSNLLLNVDSGLPFDAAKKCKQRQGHGRGRNVQAIIRNCVNGWTYVVL